MSILRIQCYCRTGFDGGREAKVVRELLFDASAAFGTAKSLSWATMRASSKDC